MRGSGTTLFGAEIGALMNEFASTAGSGDYEMSENGVLLGVCEGLDGEDADARSRPCETA